METIDSREVYSNAWMTVREDAIRRADGSTSIYGVVDRSDFAIVVPRDGERFHLVEQYRYPLGRRSWEFPAGSLPDRATAAEPIEIAHRELREETGLRAATMTYLGELAPAPAVCSNRGHYFLATDLTEGPHEREVEEQDMRSAWFTRAELESMISSGVIIDADTVAAYTLLLFHERTR
ncbi:NUDIX hydrolase [Nocardia otitidiscaviarum]|uniref:ADP-ribose pyrophosphatase n=1 Tax=Nocardia otitidiscaviarum TaxID=1823 RepID=A0A379JJ96_9NOCA|nr:MULTISPECIES: NUDIX hydrolase [Nocardia]MBF6134624.1 NUDIX hydrolase [Nocardia otitidiscaviarum]MBF6485750.1 NUDIX hydrolase [Nocardia otitidiscaviarum]SUD48053.1 ADP-ribose pyrophosphatase [Nocardia otitidiscaviarum]